MWANVSRAKIYMPAKIHITCSTSISRGLTAIKPLVHTSQDQRQTATVAESKGFMCCQTKIINLTTTINILELFYGSTPNFTPDLAVMEHKNLKSSISTYLKCSRHKDLSIICFHCNLQKHKNTVKAKFSF